MNSFSANIGKNIWTSSHIYRVTPTRSDNKSPVPFELSCGHEESAITGLDEVMRCSFSPGKFLCE